MIEDEDFSDSEFWNLTYLFNAADRPVLQAETPVIKEQEDAHFVELAYRECDNRVYALTGFFSNDINFINGSLYAINKTANASNPFEFIGRPGLIGEPGGPGMVFGMDRLLSDNCSLWVSTEFGGPLNLTDCALWTINASDGSKQCEQHVNGSGIWRDIAWNPDGSELFFWKKGGSLWSWDPVTKTTTMLCPNGTIPGQSPTQTVDMLYDDIIPLGLYIVRMVGSGQDRGAVLNAINTTSCVRSRLSIGRAFEQDDLAAATDIFNCVPEATATPTPAPPTPTPAAEPTATATAMPSASPSPTPMSCLPIGAVCTDSDMCCSDFCEFPVQPMLQKRQQQGMCAVNPAQSCFINPVNGSDDNPGTQNQPKASFGGAFGISCALINAEPAVYSGATNRDQEVRHVFEVKPCGPGEIIVDLEGSGRFFSTNTTATLNSMIIKNGHIQCLDNGGGGAAINSTSHVIVNNCSFVNNSLLTDGANGVKATGGAILAKRVTSRGCIYANNSVATSGGSMSMSVEGGAVYVDGDDPVMAATSSFVGDMFMNNRVNASGMMNHAMGGALYATDTVVEARNCSFIDNWAAAIGAGSAARGGAIRFFDEACPQALNLTFIRNRATGDMAVGGAIHISDGGASVAPCICNYCTFLLNSADSHGGAVALDGSMASTTLFLNGGRFCNNTAPSEADGYAVYTQGTGNAVTASPDARFQCQPNSPPDDAWNNDAACTGCTVIAAGQCDLCNAAAAAA